LGAGTVPREAPKLAQDLLPGASAGRDEKDMAELLLIDAIFGCQSGEDGRRRLHGAALLAFRAGRGVPATLADPRMSLHRCEPFLVGQLVHDAAGRVQTARGGRLRPASVGEDVVEPGFELVTQPREAPAQSGSHRPGRGP